jgi:hypothetical protein
MIVIFTIPVIPIEKGNLEQVVKIVGSESTNSIMTEYQNGAFAITERIVGKPLHYFICFSHLN